MQPADVLLTEARTAYGEHFDMVVDDVCSLSDASPVLVQGTALLPDHVYNLRVDPRRAIWLVPTEEFQRTHYPRRGDWVQVILEQCKEADQALENWMARDVAFAKWVSARTRALGLSLIRVDGTRTIEAYAMLVAEHFRLR